MSTRNNNVPLVSVIMVNFNGERYLEKCLSSVLETVYPNFEVILVDNASTDRSLVLAERNFGSDKRIKIVRNSANLGFGPGNNVGFDYARGKYIVFLNTDTIVESVWLTILIDTMEKDQTIGLAQSMLLEINGQKIQVAGWLVGDYLVFRCAVGQNELASSNFPPVFEVSFACGAAMIIRRELVNEIGLFDPKLPFYYDDTLLSLKTWLAGRRVVTVSKSKVSHVGGGIRGGDTHFTTYHTIRGLISLIFDIYWNLGDLIKALFIFTYALFGSLIFIVKEKNFGAFTADISAIIWCIKNLKYIWKNRIGLWSKARIDPETLVLKFIKIRIPTSLYLLPPLSAKLLMSYYENEVKKYRNSLASQN